MALRQAAPADRRRREHFWDFIVNDGTQTDKAISRKIRPDRNSVRVVCAGALAIVLLVLYQFPYRAFGIVDEWWLLPSQRLHARLTGLVLSVFEPRVYVLDTTIYGRCQLMIVKGCDGIEAYILFCAAMLALRGHWWRKAHATLAGIEALLAFNVLRFCCLYYIASDYPRFFEPAHSEVLPVVAVFFAMVDFAVCARWLRRLESGAQAVQEGE